MLLLRTVVPRNIPCNSRDHSQRNAATKEASLLDIPDTVSDDHRLGYAVPNYADEPVEHWLQALGLLLRLHRAKQCLGLQ
jgi:hypothetical protein